MKLLSIEEFKKQLHPPEFTSIIDGKRYYIYFEIYKGFHISKGVEEDKIDCDEKVKEAYDSYVSHKRRVYNNSKLSSKIRFKLWLLKGNLRTIKGRTISTSLLTDYAYNTKKVNKMFDPIRFLIRLYYIKVKLYK